MPSWRARHAEPRASLRPAGRPRAARGGAAALHPRSSADNPEAGPPRRVGGATTVRARFVLGAPAPRGPRMAPTRPSRWWSRGATCGARLRGDRSARRAKADADPLASRCQSGRKAQLSARGAAALARPKPRSARPSPAAPCLWFDRAVCWRQSCGATGRRPGAACGPLEREPRGAAERAVCRQAAGAVHGVVHGRRRNAQPSLPHCRMVTPTARGSRRCTSRVSSGKERTVYAQPACLKRRPGGRRRSDPTTGSRRRTRLDVGPATRRSAAPALGDDAPAPTPRSAGANLRRRRRGRARGRPLPPRLCRSAGSSALGTAPPRRPSTEPRSAAAPPAGEAAAGAFDGRHASADRAAAWRTSTSPRARSPGASTRRDAGPRRKNGFDSREGEESAKMRRWRKLLGVRCRRVQRSWRAGAGRGHEPPTPASRQWRKPRRGFDGASAPKLETEVPARGAGAIVEQATGIWRARRRAGGRRAPRRLWRRFRATADSTPRTCRRAAARRAPPLGGGRRRRPRRRRCCRRARRRRLKSPRTVAPGGATRVNGGPGAGRQDVWCAAAAVSALPDARSRLRDDDGWARRRGRRSRAACASRWACSPWTRGAERRRDEASMAAWVGSRRLRRPRPARDRPARPRSPRRATASSPGHNDAAAHRPADEPGRRAIVGKATAAPTRRRRL